MGWQDRDYARGAARRGPTWRPGAPGRWGKSIVTTLIAINVGVFLLVSFSSGISPLFRFGAMQAYAVVHGQFWRLITAQYLHAGTMHLLFNMIGLHFLGRPLERMWSPRKFFVIYTLCGLFGNVFYTILGAQGVINPRMPAVGASGCIFGLLGVVAVLFPTATVYVYFLFPIKIRTAAMIFGGIALFSVIKRGANYGGEACHLAGLAFGVWWAMKGDAWWTAKRWTIPAAGARPRRAKPRGFTEKVAQRRDDEETIDRILKKVYEGGIHSLSESEKRSLAQATERQRKREEQGGRVDRL